MSFLGAPAQRFPEGTTSERRKPITMLIPDSMAWVLGTWASEIRKWNSDRYDFIIFPYGEIEENKDLFYSVLKEVDVIHCLTQWRFPAVKATLEKAAFRRPALISTIHHIVHFSQVEPCVHADRIVVTCTRYFDQLISEGVDREKLRLIYSGVDTEFFSPRDRRVVREKLGFPENSFVVGFSGKQSSDHDNRKGLDIFTRALGDVSSRIGSELHIGITGPGWETVIESRAWRNAKVRYFRYLPNEVMPDFYSALDAYLVTARAEGGPLPLLEAMSCGTAVITTPVGAAGDFVIDGNNGIVVPIGDERRTAEAVLLLHRDRSLRKRISREGRRTVVDKLQWRSSVGGMDGTYDISVPIADPGSRKWTSEAISSLNVELAARDKERWERMNRLRDSAATPKVEPVFRRIVRRVGQYAGKYTQRMRM